MTKIAMCGSWDSWCLVDPTDLFLVVQSLPPLVSLSHTPQLPGCYVCVFLHMLHEDDLAVQIYTHLIPIPPPPPPIAMT